jgi:hypothetical protein
MERWRRGEEGGGDLPRWHLAEQPRVGQGVRDRDRGLVRHLPGPARFGMRRAPAQSWSRLASMIAATPVTSRTTTCCENVQGGYANPRSRAPLYISRARAGPAGLLRRRLVRLVDLLADLAAVPAPFAKSDKDQ